MIKLFGLEVILNVINFDTFNDMVNLSAFNSIRSISSLTACSVLYWAPSAAFN